MSNAVTEMDYNDILNAIPHRPPFLLIDKVVDIVAGESATGIRAVSSNEPYFVGHFPSHPVMPGVLIIEAMAQTAACLVSASDDVDTDGKLVFFTTIDGVKFRKPTVPGVLLELKVKKISSRGPLWKFEGEAHVEGNKVTEAQFSAMIVDPSA